MTRAIAFLLFLLPLAACGSVPTIRTEAAPDLTERERELRDLDAKRRDFDVTLLKLDQAMDSYVMAVTNRGETRADANAARLEKTIRDMVLDVGTVAVSKNSPQQPGENYRRLIAAASDGSDVRNQGIALAALGFAGASEVMPTILQGAQLEDPYLVDHAVLGLAVLRSPKTPPGVLEAVVLRKKHPEDGRAQAAWALYQIQEVSESQSSIKDFWVRCLTTERETLPLGVVVTAVRGLGLSRDPQNAELVAGFLTHPTPRLRMAAAIALGRMNAQTHSKDLIALLGPQETVQNVRLCARKALADLAGGVDYGYDVIAWRKIFDRGQ